MVKLGIRLRVRLPLRIQSSFRALRFRRLNMCASHMMLRRAVGVGVRLIRCCRARGSISIVRRRMACCFSRRRLVQSHVKAGDIPRPLRINMCGAPGRRMPRRLVRRRGPVRARVRRRVVRRRPRPRPKPCRRSDTILSAFPRPRRRLLTNVRAVAKRNMSPLKSNPLGPICHPTDGT